MTHSPRHPGARALARASKGDGPALAAAGARGNSGGRSGFEIARPYLEALEFAVVLRHGQQHIGKEWRLGPLEAPFSSFSDFVASEA